MKYDLEVQTSPYVMLSSDYSKQEPSICSYVANDQKMIQSFIEGKDIYATVASISFGLPYEECLEFHPETHEYQKEGKARRGEAKSVVLGILYGRSTVTIGEQLYGHDESLTPEERTKKAQKVYDSVLNEFPGLKKLMKNAQAQASKVGYVETILGRRRHIPDMMLPPFEFVPMKGYVNPDIDPLDPETLKDKSEIPERIVKQLKKEFKSYKYFGQIVKRTKELKEEKIKVINNRSKITEASRQCVNCVDADTEILTVNGWRTHDTFNPDKDMILSYNMTAGRIQIDRVLTIHKYTDPVDVVVIDSPGINAAVTGDHRWVEVDGHTGVSNFITTKDMLNKLANKDTTVHLRKMGNGKAEGDDKLYEYVQLFTWIIMNLHHTDEDSYYLVDTGGRSLQSIQSVSDAFKLNLEIKDNMIKISKDAEIFDEYNIETDMFDFATSLNSELAYFAYLTMMNFNYLNLKFKDDENVKGSIVCRTSEIKDWVQHILVICGMPSISGTYTSKEDDTYYTVSPSYVKTTQIHPEDISLERKMFVWCVTTTTGTWIARRHGHVYVTGNSIIQGSAADLTKMAILNLCSNKEWQKLGGRIVTPIHDELLCEVPLENAEEGSKVLSNCMVEAADFLPWDISCDVETTLRWYGNEFPCPYQKPTEYPSDDPEGIKWIQWCLLEMEYILPVYKNEDGETPRGNEGRGMNGIISDEYQEAIIDYMNRYKIKEDEFLDHIEQNVIYGLIN